MCWLLHRLIRKKQTKQSPAWLLATQRNKQSPAMPRVQPSDQSPTTSSLQHQPLSPDLIPADHATAGGSLVSSIHLVAFLHQVGRPILPIGSIGSGSLDPFFDLGPAHLTHRHLTHRLCSRGSGQLPNGSTRPTPILSEQPVLRLTPKQCKRRLGEMAAQS